MQTAAVGESQFLLLQYDVYTSFEYHLANHRTLLRDQDALLTL